MLNFTRTQTEMILNTGISLLTYHAAWQRHVYRAWHVAPKQPGLESSRLRCLGCFSAAGLQRRRFTTINQLKHAIVIEWGKLSQRFIDRAIVSGVAGLSASSSSKADTLNIVKTAWCDSYFRQ